MPKTQQRLQKSEGISLSDLDRYSQSWILESEIRQHSAATVSNRKLFVKNLLWFMRQREYPHCGTLELRQFLAYVTNGHKEPGGRWGSARQNQPVRPRTVKDYYTNLRTLFNWVVAEDGCEVSPLSSIQTPIARADHIEPFTTDQVKALYNAAKRGRHPRRDETIILFLLDTGMRASELVNLCRKDIDLQTKKCTVMGKGNKTRPVYYGQQTAKTLYSYLSERKQQHGKDMLPDEPLFLADRGTHKGERMTRNGLGQLITRLGEFAEIEKTRCSPHTFRHTFAVEFLRSGGNQFSLMQLLGHTNIQMTSKYVALAQGDVENQHRMHSPGDRLRKK